MPPGSLFPLPPNSIHESRAASVYKGDIDTAFLGSGLLIRDRREVGLCFLSPVAIRIRAVQFSWRQRS